MQRPSHSWCARHCPWQPSPLRRSPVFLPLVPQALPSPEISMPLSMELRVSALVLTEGRDADFIGGIQDAKDAILQELFVGGGLSEQALVNHFLMISCSGNRCRVFTVMVAVRALAILQVQGVQAILMIWSAISPSLMEVHFRIRPYRAQDLTIAHVLGNCSSFITSSMKWQREM